MYVFYALVVIVIFLLWIFLSRYFESIGKLFDKTTKKFHNELSNGKNGEEEDKHE